MNVLSLFDFCKYVRCCLQKTFYMVVINLMFIKLFTEPLFYGEMVLLNIRKQWNVVGSPYKQLNFNIFTKCSDIKNIEYFIYVSITFLANMLRVILN